MPRYTVIITRDITESTVVEVEAPDAEAAEAQAFDAIRNSDDTEWTLDEGSWNSGDPYVTGVEEMEG